MGHADVEQVLVVRDVVLELLPLDLLHGAAVVVIRHEIPGRQADLPFSALWVRVGVRAKHGRVVSDEHSTLGERARRERQQAESAEKYSDGGPHVATAPDRWIEVACRVRSGG